jgi:hypothetical protein
MILRNDCHDEVGQRSSARAMTAHTDFHYSATSTRDFYDRARDFRSPDHRVRRATVASNRGPRTAVMVAEFESGDGMFKLRAGGR